jgi:hypothetical protein
MEARGGVAGGEGRRGGGDRGRMEGRGHGEELQREERNEREREEKEREEEKAEGDKMR